MTGRYELVALNNQNQGKIIVSKNEKKLTLQEADLFTGLFNNKEELSHYLTSKGYLDFIPKKFVLLYVYNKKNKYLDCLYKEDEKILQLARESKEGKIKTSNVYFNYLVLYLLKNANYDLIEFMYDFKYINKYLYDKLCEYKETKSQSIVQSIKRELSKEYSQIRKIYTLEKQNKTNQKRKKVAGTSDDPYIEYLIEKANQNNEEAYEELKQMDLEKTLNIKL